VKQIGDIRRNPGLANRQTMRNGQNNKRMRGRNNNNNNNNRKGQNPLTRVYESNGPDIKIRGTASHVAEKYIQLARDAQSSGDPVGAENYFQHAEHYFRMIAAAQEQFRPNPGFHRPDNEGRDESRENSFDDSDEETQPLTGGSEPGYGREQPYQSRPPYQQQHQPQYQPREGYQPREPQPYGGREPQQHRGQPEHRGQPTEHRGQPAPESGDDPGGLPSFITGGQPPAEQPFGQNGGFENGQPDRFPLHRRRRRHRGPRSDLPPRGNEISDSRPGGD
jgi:hypothetical protein